VVFDLCSYILGSKAFKRFVPLSVRANGILRPQTGSTEMVGRLERHTAVPARQSRFLH